MVAAGRRKRTWRSIVARHLREYTGAASVEDSLVVLVRETVEGIPCPPTDLDAVCTRAGIAVTPSDDLIGAGALLNEAGTLRIIYATDLSLTRRRFTIAHELGHAVLQRIAQMPIPSSRELERLCDMFATEVLLPEPAFLGAIDDCFHISMLPALASRFQTSLTSTAIRYAELKDVSIFEVGKGRVRWGTGIIRCGLVSSLDDHLKPAIANGISGQTGTNEVYLNINGSIRSCRVEYWPMGKTGRVLILIGRSGKSNPMPLKPLNGPIQRIG